MAGAAAEEKQEKDEKSERKGPEFPLDRYEIVGIAIPGAALVAVLIATYLITLDLQSRHDALDNFAKASLGGLGLVTVAAFVAGHIVQSLANTAEDAWKAWRDSPELLTPADLKLPPPLSDALDQTVTSANAKWRSEGTLRGAWAKSLRRVVLSRIREAKRSRLIDNLKIGIAVNRGLCVVAVLSVLLECIRLQTLSESVWSNWDSMAILVLILAAISCGRAPRRLIDALGRPVTSPRSSPGEHARNKKERLLAALSWALFSFAVCLFLWPLYHLPEAKKVETDVGLLTAALVVAVASGSRAWRYTMQFEREIWVQFAELALSKS